MTVCARDVVERAPGFDALAESLTLRPWQWELLDALDGATALGTIARGLDLELATAAAALEPLEAQGLVRVLALSRSEYRGRAGQPPPESGPAPEPVPAMQRDDVISFSLGTGPRAETASSADAIDFTLRA